MSFKLRLSRVKYSARPGFSPSHKIDLAQSPSSKSALRCLRGSGKDGRLSDTAREHGEGVNGGALETSRPALRVDSLCWRAVSPQDTILPLVQLVEIKDALVRWHSPLGLRPRVDALSSRNKTASDSV